MHGCEARFIHIFGRKTERKIPYKDLGLDGKIILKWILIGIGKEDVSWIHIAQDSTRCDHSNNCSDSVKYWAVLDKNNNWDLAFLASLMCATFIMC
jgi:hypothetical protein